MTTSYDEIPYKGAPFAQSHPDRLAVMARLFGMQPAPVERCRVLELGCTDGGNIIPMAMMLPESSFLGIDLAESAIAAGQATVAGLGLRNIDLRACDLTQISPEWGQFDYIIAHGLYSWVPAQVREHVLRISKENLAPNGVVYISYNAYPGCRLREVIRDMMLFHIRTIEDPVERVAQGRALVQALVQAASSRTDAYQAFMRAEAENILERDPNVLFHDELSEEWQPFYFHEFLQQAAAYELQFLSEANLSDMQDAGPPGMVALGEADRVTRDQYRDFGKFRKFRQTLLCHGEVDLLPEPLASVTESLFIDSPARLEGEADGVKHFTGQHGAGLKTAHPLAIRIIEQLMEAWPGALTFDDVAQGLNEEDRQAAVAIIMAAWSAGMVQLHEVPAQLATSASKRPLASPLARLQARNGDPLTTLRHSTVAPLGDTERKLVELLDGTHDRQAITEALRPLRPEVDDATFAAELDANLNKLAYMALLSA